MHEIYTIFQLNLHSNAIVRVLFLCYFLGMKNEIKTNQQKEICPLLADSYDNEIFCPQFWREEKECIATTTQIQSKISV